MMNGNYVNEGCCCCLVAQSCLILCDPMDCSPPGSSGPWDFPGKNTEVGCHFHLQEIFPMQGANLCFLLSLHWHFAGRKCFLHFLFRCATCEAQILSQFSTVAQSCLTPCDPMDCSTRGFPVHHQLPEPAQTHVH